MGKGVMFTISFFLMATLIIGMGMLIFKVGQSTEVRELELSIENRIYDLSTSIGKTMGDMLLTRSGVNVQVQDNSVRFTENVINNKLADYVADANEFKTFVEEREKTVKLNINEIGKTRVKIQPYGALYHNDGLTPSEYRFIDNVTDVSNVTVTVTTQGPANSVVFTEFSSGSTSFRVILRNPEGEYSDIKNVDINSNIKVNLVEKAAPFDAILLEVTSNNLKIGRFENIPEGSYNLDIYLGYANSDKVKAYMEDTFSIDFQNFNVNKTTKPRIM